MVVQFFKNRFFGGSQRVEKAGQIFGQIILIRTFIGMITESVIKTNALEADVNPNSFMERLGVRFQYNIVSACLISGSAESFSSAYRAFSSCDRQ